MTVSTTSTATGLPVSQAPARRRPAGLGDPGRIRVLAVAPVIVTVALATTMVALFGAISSGLGLIANQAAPGVAASTTLSFRLSDMDAQVANVLLVGNATGLGVDRQQAQATYATDRGQADQALQQAAVTASGNPGAQRVIRTVLGGLGQYEALAAEAMYLDGLDNAPAGRPPAAALALYRQATAEMQNSVLPAVNSLTSVDAAVVGSAYQARRGSALTGIWVSVLLGLLALAILIMLQVYLAYGHRRVLNLPLAVASVLVLVLTVAGATTFSAEANDLKVAKADAFDSILALSQARAASYAANADESRYLVDPSKAGFYQQDFEAKSQQVVNLPGAGISGYDGALSTAVNAYVSNSADIRFGGYIGTAFRNIVFPGEQAAAQNMLYAYQTYEQDDRQIRATKAAGNLRGAISIDTSHASGNSDWAFTQYSNALNSVMNINQRAFSQAIQAGQHSASGWTGVIPAGSAALIALLVLLGVWPRLAEYRR